MSEQVRKRPLKVGIILPDTEREMGGKTPRWKDIAEQARFCEDAGFDSIWVFDHLIYRYDDMEPQGPWECWSNLAALAAITSRVEIGPVVCCTSFRNPALLAKIADTVDEISGGRLILGIGAGWNEPDYREFGFPYDHRVSRFEESLIIMHGLLRTGRVDFEGTYSSARLRVAAARSATGGPADHDRILGTAHAQSAGEVWRHLERVGLADGRRGDRASREGRCGDGGGRPRPGDGRAHRRAAGRSPDCDRPPE
jgi:alkanesulfonate monooxygenase SsuD/methylene tetrahydromethanopterin reductase-like flavin-dependent oxidoreductase (luciferase family)